MRARTPTLTRRVPTAAARSLASAPTLPSVAWWKRPRLQGAGVVALGLVVLGGWGVWRLPGRHAAALGPEARRVAVLYFDDKSKDHTLDAVADGLTESLIRSLGSASSMTVISRSGVERYRGSSVGADSVARALRVGYLVRGEVEPDGNQVRVSVRLDDASGVNLKRAGFAVPAGSVLAMRDTLAIVASDLIRQQLGSEIQIKQQRSGTEIPAAWLSLQRGSQAQRNGEALNAKGDGAGLAREFLAADSLYGLAEKEDPHWADPVWTRAALAYRRSRLAGADLALVRRWVDVGIGHADRAVALDPNSADAYEMRGTLRYWSYLSGIETDKAKKDAALGAARVDLEKATSLNRNQAGAYATLSHMYYYVPGATNSDVYIAAQRALDADEFLSSANLILSRLFNASYDLGQFDRAQQWCDVARSNCPRS
jgi:serine/threonine-protein kinase